MIGHIAEEMVEVTPQRVPEEEEDSIWKETSTESGVWFNVLFFSTLIIARTL